MFIYFDVFLPVHQGVTMTGNQIHSAYSGIPVREISCSSMGVPLH